MVRRSDGSGSVLDHQPCGSQEKKTGSFNTFQLPLIILQKAFYRALVFHIVFVMSQALVRNGDQQPERKEPRESQVRLS